LIGRDIPAVTIPGIDTAELDFEARPRGRRPAATRSAPERSRSRPAQDEARPARDDARGDDRPARRPRPASRPAAERPIRQDESHVAADAAREANVTPFPQRERAQPRPVEHDGPSAPGFGDHLPAFLRRPLPSVASGGSRS
jgi:hypothetical protein